MSSLKILDTPDSSCRSGDNSTTSSPSDAIGNQNHSPAKQELTPAAVGAIGGIGNPSSPRASDTAIVVPRRIFVGGFPQTTTEHELRAYFEKFGNVRDVKIIRDHLPGAKGKYSYGFITFESDDEAKKLIAMGKEMGTRAFEFRGRYLNVNEAVKKPPFNKVVPLDSVPPTGVVLRDINGQLFTIQNGYAIFASPDSYTVAQPQPMTPQMPLFIQHHPVYMTATAPPGPLKYTHQTASSNFAIQQSPASAPVLQQHPNSATPQTTKPRFVYPPLAAGHQPFAGNQLAQLPPTPIASPINQESSPSKNLMTGFSGNNPAITNLTNPFPSILGSNPQIASPSPYWTTSTIAGPVTQWVYPGNYHPTIVHETSHPFSPLQTIQSQPPAQQPGAQGQSQTPLPPQTPIGNGMVSGYYHSDVGDYNSYSVLDSFGDVQNTPVDRRQMKNAYRMETGITIKD